MMTLYSTDNSPLMQVSAIERRGNELLIKGKVFGTMPMTARLSPAEALEAVVPQSDVPAQGGVVASGHDIDIPAAGRQQRAGWGAMIGATLVALFCAPTGKFLCEWVLGTLPLTPRGPVRVSWGVAWLSAFLGSYSHVLIDSIVHADVHPLAPVTSANWLLDLISPAALHGVLVCSGLVGTALYVAVSVVVTRRCERSRRAHGVACGGGGCRRGE